jgi:glycosyltransferase involved in cell wall biosynthesis
MDNNKNKKIFFFFPYYHTGGAEKVHLQIVKCLYGNDNIILFTDRSRDKKNKNEFYKNARCFNLFGVSNKVLFIKKIIIFFLSLIINRFKNPIVMGSNSRLFYEIIPKLGKNVKVIDVVHWLDGEVGDMAVANTSRVDKRVIITPALKPILKDKYEENKVNEQCLDRMVTIENCIAIPKIIEKDYSQALNILYIGRDSYEKRPQLAANVWKANKDLPNINFIFIGRGIKKYFKGDEENKVCKKEIYFEEELQDLYRKAHVIFLTSIFEGFPMVFMEAMSNGVVPISTAVGGIPVHLQNEQNSLLVRGSDEAQIVRGISDCIRRLDKDRELLKKLSMNARDYARANFSCDNYCKNINNLINGLNNK